MLRVLTETGKILLGWDEEMPNADGSIACKLFNDWNSEGWPRGGRAASTLSARPVKSDTPVIIRMAT